MKSSCKNFKVNMDTTITLENGHKIWTKRVGDGPGLPLLLLHGGPGAGHDYLEPLAAIGDERPVIFYDQLGCGKSDIPGNPSLWTIERFADEVQEVREKLGIDRCHLMGQSWGGWLGLEYLLREPAGLASVILASTSASIPEFSAECERLIEELPKEHRAALRYHGNRGDFKHPDYVFAEEYFYRRHLCRLSEWPDCLMRTVENLRHSLVYPAINGPNEFTTIGNLRYWDRTTDLYKITTPVLITCGRYDELGPRCAQTLHAGVNGSTLRIFEESAHVAHIEEAGKFLECISSFLKVHD